MKAIVDFFLERSLIVNLLSILIVIVGVAILWGMKKEMFPNVEFDVVIITTDYPGSSSEDVEKLVTISIERNLKGISGIKKINAISAENRSIVYIEVDPDADLDEVVEDIKTAVDQVDDLPEDAETPIVRSASNKDQGAMLVTLTGGDYESLRVVAKKLRDRIEMDSNVSLVELNGYSKDEIRIQVRPDKLNAYELTFSEIVSAINSRNLNLSAGTIETDSGDIFVRTLSEFESTDDIKNVVIRSNSTGQNVMVKDVAYVERGPLDDDILQRSDGKRAIFLNVKIKETADIIRSNDKIKEMVQEFFKSNDYGPIQYRWTDDLSYYVKRRLNILKDNGVLGMVLVLASLMLFLNFRTSIMTATGAPIAFMISFFVMSAMGISLNLITMFALIMVLGMLVDDSIIVAEHFYQKLEQGLPPKRAAREAALETVRPVAATILTTMVAFGALFFMGGIMGKFLWAIPAVVIICLVASFLECFLILPSHLADFCKLNKQKKEGRWYDHLLKSYGKTLSFSLKNSVVVFIVFLLTLGGFAFVATKMRFELFPGDDVRIAFLQLKGKVGSPLSKTDEAVKVVEKTIVDNIKHGEMDQMRAQVGVLRGDHGSKTGSHYGSLILYLTPPTERKRNTDDILNDIVEKAKLKIMDYDLNILKLQGGPPKGKPVEIELTSNSLDLLKESSKKIRAVLDSMEGVTSTEIDFEEGKKQLVIKVNDQEARRLGLTTRQIAFEFRRAFAGDSIAEIRESDEDIDIKIMLDEISKKDIESIKKLYILNPEGRRIHLARVVQFEEQPGAFIIRRLNRKRIFSVSGSIDKDKTTPVSLAKKMEPKVKEILKDYPEVDYFFGGENEDTKESMQGLIKSMVISLLCIYFILIVMFGSMAQPFIIMLAIPFGFIGVIIAFLVFGQALSFMAFLGVVGLSGVVVNDSIVLVNFINKKREECHDLVKSIYEASLSRFRPVILTTVTTVAGLLPVAHDPGGDPFVKPMAMSMAWGLLFATFVTLIFIPVTYLLMVKIYVFLQEHMSLARINERLINRSFLSDKKRD